MTEIRKSTDINASPDDVFTLLADLDRLPDWSTITVATHDAPDQPLSKGNTFRQTLRVMGRQLETDWTVTELDRPRHVAYEAKGPAGAAALRMAQTVEPSGNGSQVSFELDYELTGGAVGGLAAPLIERRSEREVEHSLHNLKDMAEHGGRSRAN
jgi:carbon monoxide dehydrogenase subunit G